MHRVVARRHAAVLFADVVGYSRLMGQDEEGTYRQLSALRSEIIEPTIGRCQGRVVAWRGDGTLAEFPSVVGALWAALETQDKMEAYNLGRSQARQVVLRIGINSGEVLADDESIYGNCVNIAARLENIAGPGDVFVSEGAFERVKDRFRCDFECLGVRPLKNISDRVCVYRVRREDSRWLSASWTEPPAEVEGWTQVEAASTQPSATDVPPSFPDNPQDMAWRSHFSGTQISPFVDDPLARQRVTSHQGKLTGVSQRPSRIGVGAAPTIAVLPFGHFESDAESAHLGLGLADDLSTTLSRLRELRVVSRHAVRRLAHTNMDPLAAGQALRADYVLEATVHRRGEQLRLSVVLSEVHTGHEIWTHHFDLQLGALFSIIDEVVAKIGSAVLPAVEFDRVERTRAIPTNRLYAYDYYLRGKYLFFKPSIVNCARQALTYFELAIASDPSLAVVYPQLIRLYNTDLAFSEPGGPLDENRDRACVLARRLLDLDVRGPNSHIAMGWCQLWRGDFARAQIHFDEALRLGPYEAERLNAAATGVMYLGQLERALLLMRQAVELAPFHIDFFMTDLGQIYFLKEAYAEAIDHLDVGDDRSMRRLVWRAAAYGLLDDTREARRDAECFVETVRERWIGAAEAGPREFVAWFLRFCPFRRRVDAERLTRGMEIAGLPLPMGAYGECR